MAESRKDSVAGARPVVVRDSLYDRIQLRPQELGLLRTTAFLRLEGIKQLGFVSRVWPGARHTRFEHSVGVLELTRRALRGLGPKLLERSGATALDLEAVSAAALLHDIGHYPYSHAIEELGPPIKSHEEVGRSIVESSEVATVLERDWKLNPARVASLVQRQTALSSIDRLLAGLLSGTLDMDKLDYLPRDAKACNVPYGGVDSDRLLDALEIAEVDGELRIVVNDKGISPLHSLINARQEMFDNVYWHHTNRACMAMLLRAVQDALLSGALTAAELTNQDDASLLALLERSSMPSSTQALVQGLRLRRLHKRAAEFSARAGVYQSLAALYHSPERRRVLETQLAQKLATMMGEPVQDHEVLIDIPKPERWPIDVWVRFRQPPVGLRALMPWQEVVGVSEDDLQRYEGHRRLIRIVTTERLRERVRADWGELLLPGILTPTS